MATLLLDKMAVAGRLGNAELEDLSGIFGRIGDNASSAGMSFDKTLAFVEVLSKVEKNPERLATLADSTLRMFTNSQYAKKIQSGTGIKFFDGNEARRDAFDVLNDIKANYDKLKTDEDRQSFIARILKGADLDTIKGMRTLLKGDLLSSADKFTRSINNASGTMKRDMQDAMDNAVDQAGRLKAILGKVGDDFSRPINKFLAKSISYTTNSKENGGLGLSGADLVGGAAVAGLSTWLISSILKRKGGGVGKAAGGLGGLLASKGAIGANIAEGKIYEQMGVQSVFVVNMPNSLTNGEGLLGGAGAGAAGGLGQVGVGAAGKSLLKFLTPSMGSLAGKGALAAIGTAALPIGIAAASTVAIEQILAHGTNFLSGGKYKNYAEIFFGDSVARANQGVKPVDPNSPEGLELRRQTREKNEQQQINNNITAQVFIDGKQINAEKTNITERRGSLK
jgi:hypothetical protein